MILPAHCSNGAPDGDETDTDCGGSCDGCAPGESCRTDADCRVVTPECSSTVSCDLSKFMCWEAPNCDDGDACTENLCEATVGCDFTTPVDVDRDGFYPLDLGCGDDCDDFRDWVNPGVMFDLGCSTTELGFGVDDDCDTFIDEDC